ncbi:hypothetical protein [Pseudarthrobacter sp. NCCP-2145]|uniref:hypothetical protein n=1 Tax=Pseudarthrobacter sp. NCCP-2145 TaxID=2942290 RepID=UPI00203F2A27|nr:hypothetical protein [Pseudarthrobacter sp. NCCP-2145]GKV71894.1 hypothetical protein NCCP2145_12750 [Pseudarthrobacter sp. NCCP-2145]
MTAVSRGPVTAFLLRAGLPTAALAIIAGIFGMHIMTDAHNMMTDAHNMPAGPAMPAAAAGPAMAPMSGAPTGNAGHGPGRVPDGAAVAETATGSSSSCSVAGFCPEMSAMDNDCVLSPGNTPLTAPMPGTAPSVLPEFDGRAAAGTNYSYSPDSPSPGDLCISRT